MKKVEIGTIKTDKRPARNGWAPGNYEGTCARCCQKFIGDKRAQVCADCGYVRPSKEHEAWEQSVAEKREKFEASLEELKDTITKVHDIEDWRKEIEQLRQENHELLVRLEDEQEANGRLLAELNFFKKIRVEEPVPDVMTKEGRKGKRGKEEIKRRVLSLHLANPTLKNIDIARHFGIAEGTVERYLKIEHSHD